ncbi:single-stranded DNA-binding protein [Wolbachia endosymbiont of Howardula sp.]|uniref:single-stranded DNA-binding protein n=1 Tax=Wolbachia endosymbiont of Howardula sp. TaxID=2916816 RepID=UPI00217D351E|nr:single-stranded DNA-binding protein [Wolbachia endosymbiont of Howardula sp.]UWI83391.1 single-stranded DNA-binding protein [Wolbachia endosymbiont of Howardula sp.]
MASGTINKVILIGNLGKDPDIRTTHTGKEMASFSLATSEKWTDKISGIRTEKIEWHNIVVFSEGLVKILKEFAHKGSKIYLEGSLRTRKWTDQNGVEKNIVEIIVDHFNGGLTLLDTKNHTHNTTDKFLTNENEKKSKHENFINSIKDEFLDDEIPF